MKQHMEYIYALLLRKIYNQNCSTISKKVYDAFCVRVSRSVDLRLVGFDWAWEYIVFQFEYWSSVKIQQGNKMNPSWVFGEKAIQRWEKRLKSSQYYGEKFLEKWEISKPVRFFSSSMGERWEKIRSQCNNTPEGFLDCQLDSRFSKESKYCKVCDYAGVCEEGV